MKLSSMSKEQVGKQSACLHIDLMSSEDSVSEDDDDQEAAFVMRPLP